MDWVSAAPDTLAKKFLTCYMKTHIHNGVNDSVWSCSTWYEGPECEWKKQILTKLNIKTIEHNDWPHELKDDEFLCDIIFEYHGSNTKLIAEIVTDIGRLSPNLKTITLSGVPVDPDWSEQAENENADDMVPAINALAVTNPNLTAFDTNTCPTNENVVNAVASAVPHLTSFSAKNGVFGENISDAALDALRLSHPGITIKIA